MALINIVLASKRRRHRKATRSSFFVPGSIASVKSSSPSPKQSGFFDEWPADCLVVILLQRRRLALKPPPPLKRSNVFRKTLTKSENGGQGCYPKN
ncbi:hypothetical protein V6N13_013492 [Hibiscus sabdariffa]